MSDLAPLPKIAYLTGHYPAVSHTFILREVEALRDLDVEVETFSIRRPPSGHLRGEAERRAAESTYYVLEEAKKLWPLIRAQGALFARSRSYFATLAMAFRMRSPGLRALLYQMFYFAEATLIADVMRRRGITHIHNHFADRGANVAILAARLTDARFSYTLHGPAELYEPFTWRLKEKTAAADFVVCISHFARGQAMYFSDPPDWPKLKIAHCGVLPDMYARKTAPRATGGTRFVFVGRLTAIKGVRVLIEAFERAQRDIPDLHLTIVGDGDDRAALERMAAQVSERITFTGYLSQEGVAEAIAQADVFVLPSFAEGLPVVLMEALASEVPVICTQVAGVSELVEDGVNGFTVPTGDAVTLSDRMVEIAKDPERRKRMGAAGRQKVLDEFDVRKEAARLLGLFAGQMSDTPRPPMVDHRTTD